MARPRKASAMPIAARATHRSPERSTGAGRRRRAAGSIIARERNAGAPPDRPRGHGPRGSPQRDTRADRCGPGRAGTAVPFGTVLTMPTAETERDPRIVSLPASEIRRRFVEFFAERGHAVVPVGEPRAGRRPDAALHEQRDGPVQGGPDRAPRRARYKRAVDYQRVLRVAGKHNDFEEVGRTTRHHTFFEMLGNWSFGDYFKREAIHFAWDFLTRDLGIPAERLAATTYKDDEVARAVWRDEIGLPPERMASLGRRRRRRRQQLLADGRHGPVRSVQRDPLRPGRPPLRGPGMRPRPLRELPALARDLEPRVHGVRPAAAADGCPCRSRASTPGMGLERLASVLQQVPSNFDTDLFTPIHARMRRAPRPRPRRVRVRALQLPGHRRPRPGHHVPHRRRRAALERGPGLRPAPDRPAGRAPRPAARAGASRSWPRWRPSSSRSWPRRTRSCANARPTSSRRSNGRRPSSPGRSTPGPDTSRQRWPVSSTTDRVVGRRVDDLPADAPVLPGAVAFRLHDTYGFPIDLTIELAAEYGVRVDRDGFEAALAEQRERSRGGPQGRAGQARRADRALRIDPPPRGRRALRGLRDDRRPTAGSWRSSARASSTRSSPATPRSRSSSTRPRSTPRAAARSATPASCARRAAGRSS